MNVLLTATDPSFRHDTGRGLPAVPGLREGGAEAADPQPAQLRRAGHRQGRHQEDEGHHGQEPTRVNAFEYRAPFLFYSSSLNKSFVIIHCVEVLRT